MDKNEYVMPSTKMLQGKMDMDTLMEMIYDAVDVAVDQIDPHGTFTLEKLLKLSDPVLMCYVDTLKWSRRAEIEEEFRIAVFIGRFNPLRQKCTHKGVNYYFFDN